MTNYEKRRLDHCADVIKDRILKNNRARVQSMLVKPAIARVQRAMRVVEARMMAEMELHASQLRECQRRKRFIACFMKPIITNQLMEVISCRRNQSKRHLIF